VSATKPKLLVVEDDPGIQNQLKWTLDQYEVLFANDKDSALAQLRRHEPAVVTLDLGLPPDPDGATVGLAILQEIVALAPHTKVIMVTGNNDRENAVKAIGLGAYDFFHKPIDGDILALIVARAYRVHELEDENRRLMQRNTSPLDGVVASSPQMMKVCRTIEKVAPTDATTLLLGESGTGKEVMARCLHRLSNRAEGAFVAINCAAIPEALLESELFGHEKGAFTGASQQRKGKIEYANGGTFFLDEVGDLPSPLQAKLLRFLQERVIERVGGRELIPVDVRVVCATHQDLPKLITEGRFREDLYYRVSEITVKIPPLRERLGDAVLLARAALDRFAQQQGRPVKGFTHEALRAIEGHAWPGNVRELENRVKRAVIMADGKQVDAEDLELDVPSEESMVSLNLREVRDAAEKGALLRALSLADGRVSQAAELLGVTRPTLYDLLKKHGLENP
jgi:two-component system, NtrC family, response regulator